MPDPANGKGNDTGADRDRIRYGFYVVVIGLGVVLLAFGFAVFRWTTAADVSAALAPITGVVGTVVGAFFGIQVGSQGKEAAEKDRKEAEDEKDKAKDLSTALAAKLPQAEAEQIIQLFAQ
jgi:Na+-transporting methylmalonyl-CoA/oxaloacetate decarboxylase gamma subunit